MTYAKLTVDGTLTVHDGVPTLDTMYREIGCELVQVIAVKHGIDMWIDEEGKFAAEPVENWKATLIATGSIFPGDRVVGSVMFTGGADDDGATVGLTDTQLDYVRQLETVKAISVGEMRIFNVSGTDLG